MAMRASGERRLPDFLVVGPPRTGTSWLHKALRGYAGLPADTKETLFFSRYYERGIDWYAEHFRACPDEQPMGEVCAAYFAHPDALARIHAHMPTCRIVCTLRDPVDRLYSYYKLMRRNGKTDLPFHKAVGVHKQMIAFSCYATVLESWRARFGADQVLVTINDDLYVDPSGYVNQVATFIGADPIELPSKLLKPGAKNTVLSSPRSFIVARGAARTRAWLQAHRFYRTHRFLRDAGVWRMCGEGGEPFEPLDPAFRAQLQGELRPEIERLEVMIGRDLSRWKGDPA